MKIALRFFASVRVALNTSAETVDVPEDVRTVGDVRRFLVARGGVWAEALGEGKVLRMAYEQRMVDESERIAEGGEVAFFPPVTGGCNEKPRSVCFGAGSVHRRSAATTLLQQRLSPRSTTTAPLYSREEKMQENGVRVPYTLGVDVGMASVGTALLADGRFLNLFVRTFDKAETDKNGESLNKIRRDARLIRRRIRRRSHRLLRLCRRMKKEGIIAAAVPAAFANLKRSPWELRCLGLDEKLSSAEWASVLYHIVKHRGFLSNRKSEAKADEDVGRMLSGIEANRKRMGEKRYRTIGEMFFRDEEFITKRNKRGEYRLTISRLDLEKELKLLFERQREYGNPYTNSVFEENVQELLMQRRPTLSGNALLDKVGPCTFETGEKRAPKSCHHAERFVWLTKLNNLRIIENGKSRALRDGERDALLELPFTLSKLTYQQVRRKLELDDKAVFNISYRANEGGKSPESGTFFEAKFFHALRKAYENGGLHDAWKRDRADRGRLDNLAYAVTCYKDDDDIRAYLREKGVEEKIIEAALSCSFTEFVHLSLKALKKIAPFMEKGDRYDTAVKNAGYAHHSQLTGSTPLSAYLPAPDKNLIRNPVVYRALNQARKLINAIVREYGPPAAVHIELARDLSRSLEDRQDIQKGQKRFQTEKEKAGEAFMSVFGREPKGPDLLKYRLYREQDGQCAYSQEPIDAHRLLEPGYVEVDHILPYSRSFDNSQNNRVLVLGRENRNKGDQTPYEYMDGAHDSGRWRRFQAWVHANKKIRQAKRNRLFRADFSDGQAESFRERNISDTRYICRAFKEMLETSLQWDVRSDEVKANRCVVVSGELTAFLRARWGLVKKREEGDLHHALDAAIVAACGRAFVKRLADYSRENETKYVRHSRTDPDTGEITYHKALQVISTQAGKKPAFPAPWRTFRAELEARLSPNPAAQDMPDGYTEEEWRGVKPIRVSRAPTRRGLGAAHKETIRSIRYFTGETGDRTRRSSAVRVPLTELKEKDLDNIVGKDRDSVLFNAVSQRMTQFGFNAKKAFARPLYKTGDGEADAKGRAPQIRNVKIGQTQPSGVEVRGGVADNDSMIRADVFTKGEGRQKRFFVVPLYVSDVVKPQLPDRAVVQGKPEEEWDIVDDTYDFLFSLYPNDWLEVRLKDGVRAGYYGGLDRSTGAISLWTHDRDQRVGAKGLVRSIGIKTALELTKYHVDMLGNLHRVHREIRKPLSGKGG
ncbi:MAG: type II CRISPR RNA-guided endonuclease Cas9 [Burkholderiaceae bacterium]|nr:type II CRISPR RNA-guided endonuclease Cas9 [Burkholderiaceae bacterium]